MAFDRAPAHWEVTLHEERPRDADAIVLLPGIPGDGFSFDPEDPQRVIDEIRAAPGPRRNVVGVWGPLPGAGATSVAVHLAAALARYQDSYLIDLDPWRGAARWFACPPPDSDVQDDELRARPVPGGFRLVEGDLPVDRLGASRVVVDGPHAAVRRAGCGRNVIVVPSGRTGVERAAEMLATIDLGPSAIVVNRTGWGGELTSSAIQRSLGHRVALELPFSPGLRDAEDRARLMTSPLSPWLNGIRRLARAI